MKKRATILLTLFLCLGAGPAFADCCDDFFGCAAAYATDGLSCVLQEIVSTIKNLISLMHNLTDRASGETQHASDAARQSVTETIFQIRSDAQSSSTALDVSLQQANAIYKEETSLVSATAGMTAQQVKPGSAAPPPSPPSHPASSLPAKPAGPLVGHSLIHPATGATTVAPPPPPPPANTAPMVNPSHTAVPVTQTLPAHGALAGLLEKALAEIQKSKTAGDQDFPKVMQLMTQAEQSEGPALQSALAAADQAINAPIRKVLSFLNGMLSDPTSLFDPTDIVNQAANDVLANLDTNIDQMTNTITAGPQQAFDAAQGSHDDLVANGQRVQVLVLAMQKAYTQRTQASLDELGQLLPLTAVATGSNMRAKMVVPLGNLAAYSQIMGKFKSNKQQIVAASRQRMQALMPALAQYTAVRNKAIAARASAASYKINFTQKMATTFANKNQTQINALRDQLIAQARSQYAAEPAMRDKIIALLTSEAARIKPVPGD